jgi:protocatechuate 3,4-dioxygenase beta subunit
MVQSKRYYYFAKSPTLINDVIHVDDTNGYSWTFDNSGSVTYDKTFTCENGGTNVNIATIRETGQSASATVTVTCKIPPEETISGVKFHDRNGNGVRDQGEEGLGGWVILLLNSTGHEIGNTTTDSDGSYSFKGLPGNTNYTVCEVLQDGWINSTPMCVNVSGTVQDLNFGNFKPGNVTVFKVHDLDGDGVDDGEPGLSGWNITITNGTYTAWALTGGDGSCSFTGLWPGNYKVCEVLQSGWMNTSSACVEITLESNETETVLFLNFKPGVISGYKWNDTEWRRNIGMLAEPRIGNWNITLYRWNGTDWELEAQTSTDENGYYEFAGLEPGNYSVVEEPSDGWTRTHPLNGYYNFTVTSGFNSTNNNFGNQPPAPPEITISGFKFHDRNADGTREPGEEGLKDWTIELWKLVNSNWVWVGNTTTHNEGDYIFTVTEPGLYKICEIPQPGWINSTPTCHIIIINQDNYVNIDFGNFIPGNISGYKFQDINGNGEKDSGQKGLQGWTITLYNASSGQFIRNTTTDENGFYNFTGLRPGIYWVNETLKDGWVQTSGNYSITIVSNQTVTGLNFRNKEMIIPPQATISGVKFHDRNGNGVRDQGEEGLGGWVIQLWRKEGSVWRLNATTTTGPEGDYIFENIPAGTYRIVEVQRDGWIQTAPREGFHEVEADEGTISGLNFGNRLAPVGGELLPLDLSTLILRLLAIATILASLATAAAFKRDIK